MKLPIRYWLTLTTVFLAACEAGTGGSSNNGKDPAIKPNVGPASQVHEGAAQDSLTYSVALDAIYEDWPKETPLVIQRETEAPKRVGQDGALNTLGVILPGLSSSTEHSFWMQNENATTLERTVKTQRPIHWISKQDFDVSRDTGSEWESFSREYSKSPGITQLSRIGYSSDGQQALLYHFLVRQHESYGEYVLLQQQNGKWFIKVRQTDQIF